MHPNAMQAFAELCQALSRTSKKNAKVELVADYLRSHPVEESSLTALYLSGHAFAAHRETILNVGGALLSRVISELAKASSAELSLAYRKYGDLGSATCDLFIQKRYFVQPKLTLGQVSICFDRLAASPKSTNKASLVRELLENATPLEAKYLVKIITGDMRIGLRESLVEEAIARAYHEPYETVRRANMLLGDIGAALQLAARHRLQDAKMRLFHPIGMMLASPVDAAEEAVSYFADAIVEDKYDGIRAQAHFDGKVARIYSRTLDEVTRAFPEIAAAIESRFKEPLIFDGEILAWQKDASGGRALPFSILQQRIGRKQVSAQLIREVAVAYVIFDVLFANGDLQLDRPLVERKKILEQAFVRALPQSGFFALPEGDSSKRRVDRQAELFAPPSGDFAQVAMPPVLLATAHIAHSAIDLDALFDEAQERGNEGLMIKDVNSLYAPGRRGKSWLKLKRELASLDVVVTAVEYGHGKRAGVLSDYTFAVRDGEQLLNIGKAYSGLTDAEIAQFTQWFLEHTTSDFGYRREVEPKILLEVAFNYVMKSDRHESGFALRFPRILRIRSDKPVAEIDTLDRVSEIFANQHKGHRGNRRGPEALKAS